jgi:hypothetical protein
MMILSIPTEHFVDSQVRRWQQHSEHAASALAATAACENTCYVFHVIPRLDAFNLCQ